MAIRHSFYPQVSSKYHTEHVHPQQWVGDSDMLRSVKNNLESLVSNDLPVLIAGPIGSGKIVAAYDVHSRSRKNKPFVVSDCQSWMAQNLDILVTDLIDQTKGGTLFLRNIDALNEKDVSLVKDIWLGTDLKHPANRIGYKFRVIASVRTDRGKQGLGFCAHNSLLTWLDYHSLTVELKSLAERKADIKPLVAYFSEINKDIVRLSLLNSAWQIIENYSWPGNAKQLKRCLDKLAILEPGTAISGGILLRHFPAMMINTPFVGAPAKIPLISRNSDLANVVGFDDARIGIEPLDKREKIREKIAFDSHSEKSKKYHPALDRAVTYIYDNFTKPFSMDELARHACISPSHLSYLFKHHLGQSFKQLLLKLRIDEAVRLLQENPERQITLVCDDVGFSDLSFFERKFKKHIGLSPGVYRDKYCRKRG